MVHTTSSQSQSAQAHRAKVSAAKSDIDTKFANIKSMAESLFRHSQVQERSQQQEEVEQRVAELKAAHDAVLQQKAAVDADYEREVAALAEERARLKLLEQQCDELDTQQESGKALLATGDRLCSVLDGIATSFSAARDQSNSLNGCSYEELCSETEDVNSDIAKAKELLQVLSSTDTLPPQFIEAVNALASKNGIPCVNVDELRKACSLELSVLSSNPDALLPLAEQALKVQCECAECGVKQKDDAVVPFEHAADMVAILKETLQCDKQTHANGVVVQQLSNEAETLFGENSALKEQLRQLDQQIAQMQPALEALKAKDAELQALISSLTRDTKVFREETQAVIATAQVAQQGADAAHAASVAAISTLNDKTQQAAEVTKSFESQAEENKRLLQSAEEERTLTERKLCEVKSGIQTLESAATASNCRLESVKSLANDVEALAGGERQFSDIERSDTVEREAVEHAVTACGLLSTILDLGEGEGTEIISEWQSMLTDKMKSLHEASQLAIKEVHLKRKESITRVGEAKQP